MLNVSKTLVVLITSRFYHSSKVPSFLDYLTMPSNTLQGNVNAITSSTTDSPIGTGVFKTGCKIVFMRNQDFIAIFIDIIDGDSSTG